MQLDRRQMLRLAGGVALAGAVVKTISAATPATAAPLPLPSGPPNTMTDFELTQPTALLYSNFALADVTTMQSFAFNSNNGDIFAIQVSSVSGSDAAGNLILSHINPSTLSVYSSMSLTGFGHGVSIGVEPSGSSTYIWTECDAEPDGTSSRGRSIARFKYQAGTTLSTSSSLLQKFDVVPGSTQNSPSVDMLASELVVRYFDGNKYNFAVYDLDSVTNHVAGTAFTPVDGPYVYEPAGTFQGYTHWNGRLFTITGDPYCADTTSATCSAGPSGNTHLTKSADGTLLQSVLNQSGSSLYYREPEGMAMLAFSDGGVLLCFGFSTGEVGARRASIYSMDPVTYHIES